MNSGRGVNGFSFSKPLSYASAAEVSTRGVLEYPSYRHHHHLVALLFILMARLPHPPSWVDEVEPHPSSGQEDGAFHSCYSKLLKADLLPGTFVLLTTGANAGSCEQEDVIARIVKPVASAHPFKVQVNIFRNISDVARLNEGILQPQGVVENHLRHLPEVVQTAELRVIAMTDVKNLAFVFTEASLHDSENLFFICQGMAIAFLLRFRVVQKEQDTADGNDASSMHLMEIPSAYCLPFPSSYKDSKYSDCFARRIWNNLASAKLEMMKLLGRYSQQQGLFGREFARMYFTAETWGFLCVQFTNLFSRPADFEVSHRMRLHRVVESGLVVKAARIQKRCAVMRFSTKMELLGLCRVFGESVTAGQRCRLPKISSPKSLWINDVINVVCGSDTHEPVFSTRTPHDGIDLEFDGMCELFITIRYTRYAYTPNNIEPTGGCDPLLSSLIRRSNPHKHFSYGLRDEVVPHFDNDSVTIVHESEFEDDDGCVYRVTNMNSTHVDARCCYPKHENPKYGCEKTFDRALTKELIQRRLNG